MSVALRCAIASARRLAPLGGLGLLLCLEPGAGLAVGLDGRLAGHRGLVLDRLEGRPDPLHLLADAVDLGQLLGSDQPLGHHRPVDQPGARIVGRRDQVAAAEPGIGEERLALALASLISSRVIGRNSAGVEADRPSS